MRAIFSKITAALVVVITLLLAVNVVFAASSNIQNVGLLIIAANKRTDELGEAIAKSKQSEQEAKDLLQRKTPDKAVKSVKTTKSVQTEKKRIEQQISSSKKRIASLEKQLDAQKKINADLAKQKNEQRTQDIDSTEIKNSDIRGWNSEAKCQVISWNHDTKARTITLTILHRSSGKITKAIAKFETRKDDKYFKVSALPSGLQVVMPDDDTGTWVVNVDARPGFVKKIIDTQNISASELNDKANKDDYGGKTFESGEAFIIVKQSGMTIRPPIY